MARLLQGTLYLPNGSPLANATVFLTSKRNEIAGILKGLDGAFTTNGLGYYTQSVHEGFYQVSLSHPLAGNPSRRFNLGNILVEAGSTTSVNELLQFSEDAGSPISNEIQQMYEEIIAARNAAQSSAVAAAGAATAASASATSAGTSAAGASASATAATGAAATATTKAGEAATAAGTATGAATTATTKASEATTAAATATGAATAAATKAGEATTAAGTATGAATTATTKAGEAASAAGDSIAAAELAGEAATTATAKAGEATAAATAATGAATTATTKAAEAASSANAAADSASSAATSASAVGGVVIVAEAARDAAIGARDDAAIHQENSENAAGESALWQNISMQFAQNDEDVPVIDGEGNPIGFSARHYAEKAEASAGGGITPSTVLSFLTAKQGGAFGPTSTMSQAMQAIVDSGLGATNTYPEAPAVLDSFADFWALPQDKPFLIVGGSAIATYLNSITTNASTPYSIGNANTRDVMVKVASMEWVVAGNTFRKVFLNHRGQGGTISGVGLNRYLNLNLNVTSSALTVVTNNFAEQSSIPVERAFIFDHSRAWVLNKNAKFSQYYASFRRPSNCGSVGVNGGFVLSDSVDASSGILLFHDVALTDIIAVDPGAQYFRPDLNFPPITDAVFRVSTGSAGATSINAELVFSMYTDAGITKVSMMLKNMDSGSLAPGGYVFSGGYSAQ